MILPGFPVLLSKASGGSVFPAVTVGRANIANAGIFFGYVRPGGYFSEEFGGISGGTLSATLVPGFVTDAVVDFGEGIFVIVIGDCEAVLSGVTALMDNGTPLPIEEPAEYDSGHGVTSIQINGSWTSAGISTVQLV